jgi:hypothetical protein
MLSFYMCLKSVKYVNPLSFFTFYNLYLFKKPFSFILLFFLNLWLCFLLFVSNIL